MSANSLDFDDYQLPSFIRPFGLKRLRTRIFPHDYLYVVTKETRKRGGCSLCPPPSPPPKKIIFLGSDVNSTVAFCQIIDTRCVRFTWDGNAIEMNDCRINISNFFFGKAVYATFFSPLHELHVLNGGGHFFWVICYAALWCQCVRFSSEDPQQALQSQRNCIKCKKCDF